MTKKTTGRRIWVTLFLSVFACFFVFTSALVSAGQEKHIVQKGDTLWSICEKYYGNPNLWPKLWQMNPFVTNPHLLKPGDEIKLIEGEPLKKAETERKPAQAPEEKPSLMQGIDLSGRINLEALGYLSLAEVEPLGVIESSTSARKILASGDNVFVTFREKQNVKPGDTFSIAHRSDLIRHPLTGKRLGYLVFTKGTLSAKEHLQKGIYLAEVSKSFSEILIGDLVMPLSTRATCVKPLRMDTKLYGNVVATHDNRRLVGKGTIVYLDSGSKSGVQPGAFFDLIRIHKLRGETIYESTVGKLMILDSRPDTSSGIVLSCSEESEVGVFVKGTSWVEPPDVLTSLPSCAFQ